MDWVLTLKLIGAILAFGLGIWIGVGMPGMRKDEKEGEGRRRRATLERTWMNRMMKNRLDTPRRFDAKRIVRPDSKKKAGGA